MSQIDIKVLKQGILSRNVVTCCFFTVGEAYRDFRQYIGNLKRFIQQTELLKTFELRIYTDDTGKDIALAVSDGNPRVTVLHYDCPQFREGRGHKGMFGTLVRFLPIFEDLDVVWCSDIDIPDRWLDERQLHLMNKHKCDFFLAKFICYDDKVVWNRKNTILAGRFITKIQFPRALLTRFLNMFTEGKLSEIVNRINDENTNLTNNKPASEFPYGMDEVFLNTSIYNWMMRHNKRILLQTDYFIRGFAYEFGDKEAKALTQSYHWFPTHSKFLKLKKLFEKYLPILMKRHICYKEFFDNLPNFKNDFIVYSIVNGSDL
uniref:Glycosyltransferase n=1 Tax=viral metagenome TaxID=1070528 RepID=A0A6C0CUV9_9ZZZZ